MAISIDLSYLPSSLFDVATKAVTGAAGTGGEVTLKQQAFFDVDLSVVASKLKDEIWDNRWSKCRDDAKKASIFVTGKGFDKKNLEVEVTSGQTDTALHSEKAFTLKRHLRSHFKAGFRYVALEIPLWVDMDRFTAEVRYDDAVIAQGQAGQIGISRLSVGSQGNPEAWWTSGAKLEATCLRSGPNYEVWFNITDFKGRGIFTWNGDPSSDSVLVQPDGTIAISSNTKGHLEEG